MNNYPDHIKEIIAQAIDAGYSLKAVKKYISVYGPEAVADLLIPDPKDVSDLTEIDLFRY
jgi:DNA-binding transcriptional MerR regulator